MKVLNIIDTNQLITDAEIVKALIERKQSVIVPLAVKKELAKVLDDKIFNDKGERISVNVLTFNNYCDMYVALTAYSESENRELKSEYVSIGSGQWVTLCLDIDKSVYNYINLDIIPMKDSVFYDNFDGIYAYVDDFKVTKSFA